MTGSGNWETAGAAGHGSMRVSDADRERAIEVLKSAFVQERLSKYELDSRAFQVYQSRTYDELNACTTGISPARPRPRPARNLAPPPPVPAARQPELPYRSRKRTVRRAVGWSACLVIPPVLVTAFFTYYGGFAVMMLAAFIGVTLTASPIGPGATLRDRG
jgi:hypothetical protein